MKCRRYHQKYCANPNTTVKIPEGYTEWKRAFILSQNRANRSNITNQPVIGVYSTSNIGPSNSSIFTRPTIDSSIIDPTLLNLSVNPLINQNGPLSTIIAGLSSATSAPVVSLS
ncbi:hypothetical protein ACMFMG_000386 [Clarireedia jacksonii]